MSNTSSYEIAACDGQWVVSASGVMILACKRKRVAIAAVRAAEKMLLGIDENDADPAEGCGDGCVQNLRDQSADEDSQDDIGRGSFIGPVMAAVA